MVNRATGWIQDSGSLENLIKVVELFNFNSDTHLDLIKNTIINKVLPSDGQNEMIQNLNSRTSPNGYPEIDYRLLVGTGFKPRSSARCNGIIQALIIGQRRDFISDWPANNFLRMAETFGFVTHNEQDDTYSITDFGLILTSSKSVTGKFNIIKEALLKYPPVTRILVKLNEAYHNNPADPLLTKFELGQSLGFIGEDGFTSFPQQQFVHAVATESNTKAKNKIKTNWEGSSDKYARMISDWLSHDEINWVEKASKNIYVNIGGVNYQSDIQSFKITLNGIIALKNSRATSSKKKIEKLVPYEMLATKGKDINYLRTRRALLINYTNHKWRTLDQIVNHIKTNGLTNITQKVILQDLKNLENTGFHIKYRDNQEVKEYSLVDKIVGLSIPTFSTPYLIPSEITNLKTKLINKLTTLDAAYLDLIDLGFSGTQNKLYELRVVDLFNQLPKVAGQHLSGGNRPEIIVYYPATNPQYGIIIDTKAYSKGFPIPIAERDKMVRYIDEYDSKTRLNPTKWWENFKSPNYPSLKVVYAFVSGTFKGNFQNQLNYIKSQTGYDGNAISSHKLILKIDQIMDNSNSYGFNDFINELSQNNGIL